MFYYLAVAPIDLSAVGSQAASQLWTAATHANPVFLAIIGVAVIVQVFKEVATGKPREAVTGEEEDFHGNRDLGYDETDEGRQQEIDDDAEDAGW